jgi:phosphoribosyl-ATP pyrophosphohydrolase
MLHKLYKIIENRKQNPKENSYTNKLLVSGQDRIVQKFGEESIEVVIAASNQTKQRLIEETSDLFYHLFVLMVNKDITISDIEKELESRHAKEIN